MVQPNAIVERVIGSIRRECLDHVIVLGENHLRRILKSYVECYNHRRLHQSLDYRTPAEVYFQTAAAHQKQTAVIESTIAAKGKGATLDGALFLS